MRRCVVVVAVLGALAAVAASAMRAAAPTRACAQQHLSAAYAHRVDVALRSGRDLWGRQLLAAPDGPTYAAARRYLTPLLLARGPHGTRLTATGYHYVPFAATAGPGGTGAVALHVADGSEIFSDRVGGRSLRVWVGAGGKEGYGACLARVGLTHLLGGLPVLETRYTDARGSRYEQESFAGRLGSRPASFVRLSVRAVEPVTLRLVSSVGGAVTARAAAGATATLFVAWPAHGPPLATDEATFTAARDAETSYWGARLAEGASIDVPEPRVEQAERALLVQNLTLGWRYSVGNAYEEFSFPEGLDVAEVMAGYGFADASRAILRTALTRPRRSYADWQTGQELVASATQERLFHDDAYVDAVTPQLARAVAALGAQLAARGILARERYSSDVGDLVYGLHSQAIAWQGLRLMAETWQRTGHSELAARARTLADRLGRGLRRAVRSSETRLPDGTLFIPAGLLDHEPPYASLVASRRGSYWNLVAPYALASGLFAPGGAEARGALAYMRAHGSRLLGLVRAGGYALYGRGAPFPISGTDEVYGLNVSRFLADNDEPDELVLSLYGQLAAAMAPGTFVSGEGATVAPLPGSYDRTMYLPPNAASNASFLETLHLMLVQERDDGLQLAFATPRAWLASGRTIAVTGVPTRFGPVSFVLHALAGSVDVSLDVPASAPRVVLRLRLPRGRHATVASVAGRQIGRFDRRTETLRIPGGGHIELTAAVEG